MVYREKMDKSIMDSLKNRIQRYLQKQGLSTADFLRENMDKVDGLYVENSLEQGGPRMQSRGARPNGKPAEIMIDKQFVEFDKNGNPIGIDNTVARLIHSQIGHELLHSAARFDGHTGIMVDDRKRGLNEGFTQMFTEKIFGYVVSPNSDNYKDYKKVAKILDTTFGEQTSLESYFNHTDDMKKSCNSLSGDENFYDSLNETMTSMYYIKKGNRLKDDGYKSLTLPLYDKLNDLVFQKVCAQIIIPKLKTLDKDAQKEYLTALLDNVRDDQSVARQLADTIKNFGSMNPSQLDDEINRIEEEIKRTEQEKELVNQLYTENDYSKLITLDENGRVFLANDPSFEITNDMMLEKIYSHLYYQDKNYSEEDKKRYTDKVVKKCESLEQNDSINFKGKAKDSALERKKNLASIRATARQNGYIVLNTFSECEQGENLSLKAVKEPTKDKQFSFEDLRKVYESYTIDYEEDVNNQWKMVVKDRATNQVTEDLKITKLAKFASIWAEAAGTKWMADEEIKGITYAFNESSEEVYNQIGGLVSKCMTETGQIDTRAIYDEISKGNYKHSEEIINSLLANPVKLEIMYDFYKMQNPDAKMEIKSAKTSSEFARGIKGDDYISAEVDDILSSIPQVAGNTSKIDELIELAEQSSENARGGNKKCFINGNDALLYGEIDEANMQSLIQLTEDLKSRGVNVARTFDYKITDGTKGYSLQEKAEGTPLHNRVKWNLPKEELPMQKQVYTDRLKELSGESQEFYDKFVQDWLAIQDAGIRIDPSKMDNFYYEQGKGITFIDLDAGVGKVDEKGVALETVCHEMATILAGSGKYWSLGKDEEISKSANKSLSPIFKKFAKSMQKAGLPMKEIKAILKEDYPDVDLTDPIKKYQDPVAQGKADEEEIQTEITNSSSFRESLETSTEPKKAKFNTGSFRESLESAKVKTSEVKGREQQIAERNEYKRLIMQKSKGLTPEQQARYDMLHAKYYMTPEEKQQQGQKKGIGMSM